MSNSPQIKIPATYLRGGTSKGVFFEAKDLPPPGPQRDAILLRVLGSPDPYGKQIDGLGNASSSTSKAVILSKSTRPGHDVDYLFGQVSIDQPFVDWSGNCGNLSAAVGPCAIHLGLIDAARIPIHGSVTVRIWQANIGKTIVAHVPISNGQVQETGDFELDGVTFPAAEVPLEFLEPADESGAMFPTGNVVDTLEVPGVGSFQATLINASIPIQGSVTVRIWQANTAKTIVAHVPIANGQVQETGDFELDGVTFPAAEVPLEFLEPADEGGAMFPTGNVVDTLEVPGVGSFQATMINSGIPTIFLNADALGYTGTELQDDINGDAAALARLETIRAHGALRMGLIKSVEEAAARQHTPKVAWVSPPRGYAASSGKAIGSGDVDLLVRAMSMGKLHHAMMGTASVAIATAACVPGTLVNLAAGGGEREAVRFGHPSGTLRVGSQSKQVGGQWTVTKAIMSRSARVLMQGWVHVPFEG